LEQYRCVAHCLLFSAEKWQKPLCRFSKSSGFRQWWTPSAFQNYHQYQHSKLSTQNPFP
jgi:hypothetical protein